MATVRTIESNTNFLLFPVSGTNYSLTFYSIEWNMGPNSQWIYIPNDANGGGHIGTQNPAETVFIDTNDSTAVANIQITGLSFVRSATYWSNLQTSGNIGAFLVDLLSGNDTIFGNNSSEVLVGYEGNDILVGDGAPDQLYGGNGINTASYSTSPTPVRINLAAPGRNTGQDAVGDTYFSIQNLTGSRFGDVLEGDGNANRLTGGLGLDTLLGKGGSDIFDFNAVTESRPGSTRDKLLDFNRFQDRIDLKDIDAQSGAGNQAFKFIGTAAFTKAKGQLRFNDNGATVIVQGDVNGDGRADLEIFVKSPTLSRDDFIL